MNQDRADWNERHEKLQEREAAIETRHRELDHRQAQLYRDIETFTSDKARIDDRIAEIERREAKVAEWESRLQAQGARAGTSDRRDSASGPGSWRWNGPRCARSWPTSSAREAEIDAAERQLGYRQQEIDTALKRFERLGVTEEKMQQMQEEARKFAARRRYLDEAEAQLAQEKAELTDQVRDVANQRRQLEEQLVRERRAACGAAAIGASRAADRECSSSTSGRRRSTPAKRPSHQLQEELRGSQREMLEMRLATEEIWAQLSGALAPASLTRSISQVRAKLADHYRQTIDELAQRSEQLELVRRDLAQQLDALEQQREELKAWAERRQADIEEQAARLVAREQELDRQQQHYEQMESRWHLERTDYQAEIRQLLASLRDLELEEVRAA